MFFLNTTRKKTPKTIKIYNVYNHFGIVFFNFIEFFLRKIKYLVNKSFFGLTLEFSRRGGTVKIASFCSMRWHPPYIKTIRIRFYPF